jgi:hypothetical protein
MPRLAVPEVFHPRLQFRYSFFTSKLPTATIHARSADQPSFTNQPVRVNYRSNYMMMKGRTEWNDIKLQCYSFEGITENELFIYFNKHHFDVDEGVEMDLEKYKHTIILFLLSPLGVPTGMWKLIGAFLSDVSWGSLDYGSDDIIQCDVTITYDYALLNNVF